MLGNHRKPQANTGLRPLPPAADTAKPLPQPDQLMTSAQAAKRLGVGDRVLERWRSTGDGPAYAKLTSKTIRYRSEDLDAFVGKSIRKNTAE
jgi:hypothetical protein